MADFSSHSSGSLLCRLIYKSETSWDLLSNESLLELTTKSQANNSKADITGLLALSGESFLQVLEGPVPEVNALYLRIARDKRHTKLTLLSYEQIARRHFSEWSMHVVDLLELPLEQRDYLKNKYPAEDGGICMPDDAQTAFALLLDARVVAMPESKRSTQAK